MRTTRSILIIVIMILSPNLLNARSIPLVLKGGFLVGYVLPVSETIKTINPNAALGGEFNVEFQSYKLYDWESDWRFPTIGVGTQFMDLGSSNILGQMITLYPYALVPLTKNYSPVRVEIKIGGGAAFLTKRWDIEKNPQNEAISTILNGYVTLGANIEYKIKRDFSIYTQVSLSHASNGSTYHPNYGINVALFSAGVKYDFDKYYKEPVKSYYTAPWDWKLLFQTSLYGGFKYLHHSDTNPYGIGNLNIAFYGRLARFYALGVSNDLFYNDGYRQQGGGFTENSQYNRYLIPSDDIKYRFRAGLGLSNAFIMGKITLKLDAGIYLYDGLKNNYATPHPKYGENRPLVYSYDIKKEDGWNYFKVGIEYNPIKNLNIGLSLKSHLYKAEHLLLGVGYRLPIEKKQKKHELWKNGSVDPLHGKVLSPDEAAKKKKEEDSKKRTKVDDSEYNKSRAIQKKIDRRNKKRQFR